jgi:hypothetical protein
MNETRSETSLSAGPLLGPRLQPGIPIELFIDAASFHEVFARDLPASQTTVLGAAQRPVVAATFKEKSGPPAWKHLPASAVVARSMAKRAGADTVGIEGSHTIMISQPRAVTDVILKAVRVIS